MAKYRRNYLEKVIVRIDFEEVALSPITKFIDKTKHLFPTNERKLGYESQVMLNLGEGQPKQINREVTIWTLKNEDDSKRTEVTPKWIWIEYDKYKDSDELLSDVNEVLNTFTDLFEVKVANRIGVRFLNILKFNQEPKATDWSKYLQPNLLAAINFANENKISLSRVMGQIVQHDTDTDLRFDFGIWNNDYPNLITRKEFILDFDCFTTLPINMSDIKLDALVKSFNERIEAMFEASITDNLRKILNKS